jgi:outer membrane biosynthesis protein TonB
MLTTRSMLIPALVLAAVVGFGAAFGAGAAIKKSNEPAPAFGSGAAPLLAAPAAAPRVAPPALGGAIPDLRSKPHRRKKPAPKATSTHSAPAPQQASPAPQTSAPAPKPVAPAPRPAPPPSGSNGGSSGGTSGGSSSGSSGG